MGDALVTYMHENGGLIDHADLSAYALKLREPIRGYYRGYDILGPPPPASSGVHIVQMLNILEHYNLSELGFGTLTRFIFWLKF